MSDTKIDGEDSSPSILDYFTKYFNLNTFLLMFYEILLYILSSYSMHAVYNG